VDGTVLEGRGAVDQSAITGESLHTDVGPGSPVFAGTVAVDGLLRIRVRGAGADTVLGRVVQLLADVERSTVPVLRLFERRAEVWLPLVLTVAASTLFFTEDLSRAIAVLVVATPTALVVAGPAAVVAAMSAATRLRILIKSVDFLERTSDVDTLILDKTGTVTAGAPVVTSIEPASGESQESLLRVAAACAHGSLHPVSRAIIAECLARGVAGPSAKDLQEKPGLGVVAMVDDRMAVLGRRELLLELGVAVEDIDSEQEGNSLAWVAHDDRFLGRVVLRDQPRREAREALAAMRALGIDRLVLLTGDRLAAAQQVGRALGVDEIVADVLPAQKLEVVRAEQSAGRVVMLVGDGVNDAPALSGADVGVAIGAELNEVALAGADVALLGTDLRRLPQLVALADITRRVIGQNLWLAFALSVVLIVSAARGVLNPLTGALGQSIAVVVIVANSARILRSVGPLSSVRTIPAEVMSTTSS
jgi:heavy metal translocating P-type ATPase